MARTYRRGKPSRNLKYYIKRGIVSHENKTILYSYCYSLYGMQSWKDNWEDTRTYQEYFDENVRIYHSETSYVKGVPRKIRTQDLRNQKRTHKLAIKKAFVTGDFDVVLCKLDKRIVWFDWY